LSLVIPTINNVETKENYGRFVAEPLEKGFGVTLGNALRRVLLGYLPGAAVTRVKIEGILHEFSPIPHVREDTTNFLLNVKALRLKALSGQPGKLELEVEREGRVTAADIKPSVDFEIVNPELYLATLDSPEARLYMELDIDIAVGFREAEANNNVSPGVLSIDAIFTPVRKVNFTIEPVHMGQETSHERLVLEVWTDSTITPVEALSRSADILVRQLTPFSETGGLAQSVAREERSRVAIPDEKYNLPVEQLDLSARTMNCLRRAGISTVGELLEKNEKELLSLRNFGKKSKQEIDECLQELGLSYDKQGEAEDTGADQE